MAHRAGRASTSSATGPSATTVRYDYLAELLAELNSRQSRSTKSSSSRTSSTSRRRPTRTACPATGRTGDPRRRDQRALTMRDVILARRGAGVQTWNAQGGQLRHPARSADPRPAAADRPRLDGDRRQGARQPAVPLRQHPPRGVPAADPRGAGGGAGRARRAGDEQPAGRPARRPQLRRRHGRPGGPAGLRSAARGRACVERSTDDPLSCCLNSSLLAKSATAAASPTSTTRSTT